MPKKIRVSSEVLQSAMEFARKAKTADELRVAQAVILPGLLENHPAEVASLTGFPWIVGINMNAI